MNSSASLKMQPDDPRLTAFAVGELEGTEHAQVAAAVAADPALQAAVDEITGAVAQLSAALAAEPAPAVASIELPTPRSTASHRTARPTTHARMFQFPYIVIGSLAAACFAVVFLIINQNEHAVRETARRTSAVSALRDNDGTVALTPPPAHATASAISAPDTLPTLPLVASNPRDLEIVPSPAAPGLTPAEIPSASYAVAVSPTITESPNTTPVPVRQTQADAAQLASGLGHDSRPTPAPATRNVASAPAVTLAEAPRGFITQAPLPPSLADASTRSTDTAEIAAGYFSDVFTESAPTSDHLRLTFRDFGAPRYASNPATSSENNALATGGSVAFATNQPPGENRNEPGLPGVADETRRAPDENLKTIAPRALRIPYQEPPSGSVVQDELNRRGTINQGGQIADLETQLRDLQQVDGSLDSPVQDFIRDNAFVDAAENPASVFPVAVDDASHLNVRRALLAGTRPSRDTVRIEELLNSHTYDYAAPATDSAAPFAASLEVASAPWAPQHRLVRVGLKAREVAADARPAGHYVVLIETGEATTDGGQLALIKESLRQFVAGLGPQDEVAIAHHGSVAGLVLPTTTLRERDAILAAIEQVRATGAAAGSTGLQLAYDVARSHFVAGGINRVILASDGDTRIGEARREDAARLIDTQAHVGIAFSAIGFGVRNIRESMLEQLAHRGRGEFAFVDTPRDARHALSDRAGGAFTTVARNVKLQVEFNPTQVRSWRLIGYEDRVFLREDFNHESLSADAVGAGHTVTALFEIVPIAQPAPSIDDTVAVNAEMLSVKVRYQTPGDDTARLQQFTLTDAGRAFADASGDFKFAAAVAGFGMILRESPHGGTTTFADVATWARAGRGADRTGTRAEFIDLVDRAGRVVR